MGAAIKNPTTQKVIRDKQFAKRLETAVEGHPQAPSGHGRQKWLRDQLATRFNLNVSPEGVRKWFAGEARPKPALMRMVAQVLEVDEAWLSLAITPDETPKESRKRRATADGAVNLVAGLIQMSGSTIAFPDEGSETDVDLFAIIGGKQYSIEVKRAKPSDDGSIALHIGNEFSDRIVIAVIDKAATEFDLVRVPAEVIEEQGVRKGGYFDLAVERKGSTYVAGSRALPSIKSMQNLEGVTLTPRKLSTKRAIDLG